MFVLVEFVRDKPKPTVAVIPKEWLIVKNKVRKNIENLQIHSYFIE